MGTRSAHQPSAISYGVGALPLKPQVLKNVGAADGLLSQYIRVANASAPCAEIAAFTLVMFTDFSVIEYWNRRGTFDCDASLPG